MIQSFWNAFDIMSRISIEITPLQHRKLKSAASLEGKSIKEFVLTRTLGPSADEEVALRELETLLDERIENAKRNGVSKRSVSEIFEAGMKSARR